MKTARIGDKTISQAQQTGSSGYTAELHPCQCAVAAEASRAAERCAAKAHGVLGDGRVQWDNCATGAAKQPGI